MNFRQDFNALPQQDLNKILTQFKYQFLGTSPTVETQNVDVLPEDELQVTESEMILKKYSSFILPSGSTSERPASTIQGAIRLNTDTSSFESFNGSSWTDVGGGLEFSEDNYQIEGENLCSNGTFDSDVSGWTGAIEWDATSGGRALINNCSDSSCGATFQLEIPQAGYYIIKFNADPLTISSAFFNSGSGYVDASGEVILVDYLEAGTDSVHIGNYYQTSGQKIWIDDVQIYKVASNIPIPNLELGEEYKIFLTPTTVYIGNSPNPGVSNIGFGYNSLYNNTTGYQNTALGYYCLYSNTGGDYNTGFGNYSLKSNTTGNNNTAVGNSALTSNIAGGSNTAVGNSSLYSNTTGNQNTALGYNSLYSNTTGSTNTAIGYQAYQSGTYSNSTAIGYQAQPTKSNQAVIGNNSLEELKVRNYVFNVDQTLGAGQDGWVLKYNHSTGQAEFAAP